MVFHKLYMCVQNNSRFMNYGIYFTSSKNVFNPKWVAHTSIVHNVRKYCTYDQLLGSQNVPFQQALNRKVILVNPNSSVVLTTLREAEKIAENENLRLVKIIDQNIKTHHQIYKMMTAAQYIECEIQKKKDAKSKVKEKKEKLAIVNHDICENDMLLKIHKINNWLVKGMVVRVIIYIKKDNILHSLTLYDRIIKEAKHFGRITQKKDLARSIQFLIVPKEKSDDYEEMDDDDDDTNICDTMS